MSEIWPPGASPPSPHIPAGQASSGWKVCSDRAGSMDWKAAGSRAQRSPAPWWAQMHSPARPRHTHTAISRSITSPVAMATGCQLPRSWPLWNHTAHPSQVISLLHGSQPWGQCLPSPRPPLNWRDFRAQEGWGLGGVPSVEGNLDQCPKLAGQCDKELNAWSGNGPR